MKLNKTNKDLIFLILITFWLIIGIAIVVSNIVDVHIFNMIMVIIFAILCLLKFTNRKFNKWLNTKL